ncbi:MAG: DUF819 family protein, partial [Xanthomonadales bacterium]|nr:DUF819 family protein [Gammaproteobacteria bacterium]NNL94410.1 DUF819 family protein [Xanthomonadales bacterium]
NGENLFAMTAVVVGGAAFAFWAERQRWGRQASGPVWAIVFGLLLSNFGLIPSSAPVFSMVSDLLVPAAIPLLLFKANIRRIVAESGPMLIAFFIGVAGATAGAVLGYKLLPLGDNAAELAGVFTATYTGGSMNFVAVSKAVGFDASSQYAAAMAADNLVGTPYLLVLVIIPALSWVRRRFPSATIETARAERSEHSGEVEHGSLNLLHMSLALALSLVICTVGYWVAEALGVARYGILFITAFAVAVANVFPAHMSTLEGDFALGTFFMYLFFVTIGASANIAALVGDAMVLVPYAVIILSVHMVVLAIGVKLLKIDLAEALVASNACIMGPATAAAISAGQGWKHLVTPGLLTGVLGYVIANFLGVAVTEFLG